MTKEEALAKYQAMYPDRAHKLAVEQSDKLGFQHGYMNCYSLWDHSKFGSSSIRLTASDVSFEDAFEQLAADESEVSA